MKNNKNEESKDYLLKYVRRKLEFYEDNLLELAEMAKAENRKLPAPLSETEIYRIVQQAIVAGATRPPILCDSAADLDLENAKQTTFYIPQMLADGVTFLNAPPKCGKSRMLMQMSLALSRGGKFMGRQCKKISVLYLALEDERQDFESRLKLFLNGEDAPNNLYFATLEDFDCMPPTLEGDELIELVEGNLKANSNIQAVFVDVFGTIRSKRQRGEDFTDHERRDIQSLIRLAARNKIAVVVAHHVSHGKRGQTEPIGSGAGSYVVAATVHAEMLLYRNSETNSFTFSVQGRRMPLQKFALEDAFPRWRYCGGLDEYEAANNPLILTLQHMTENCKAGKWSGFGSGIVEYGRKNGLPPIPGKINKHTFTPELVRQMGIAGIQFQQLKNGKGACRYQFTRF